ncbi:MAG: class I tRNA ligase family protein, partial [Spirochaetia bacterium]|nr:class I tRNA ligase family protein [Spirochaetia bacterium]
GLKPRAITRDLKWGIPVPKAGFEDKVFYVWFDAPIGYISMTASLAREQGFDWKSWWQNPDEVDLFQFIGKDNIPFHTVIFPSSLLGSGKKWTLLHHMSSTEYLNYEAGKFSKSAGIGVFGTDVMETGIPADVWRFYIFWNRPETSDYTFTWADFKEKVNGELIGNLGNLVNRTLTFIVRYFDGIIPSGTQDEAFWAKARELESKATASLERADLRDAFRTIFELSNLANKRFQDGEPWKTRNSNPEAAASLLSDLCYILKDIAIMIEPYMPAAAMKIAGFLGVKIGKDGLSWQDLGKREGLSAVHAPEVLFAKLEDAHIDELRERYSGSQKDRKEKKDAAATQVSAQAVQPAAPKASAEPAVTQEKALPLAGLPLEERFAKLVDLRTANIVKIERHPKADKLYIETLDDGSGTERVIVSGLVPFYKEEELLGKTIILVNNLKPAKLRGIESKGMLLAASRHGEEGKEAVEVLTAPWAKPGTRVQLEATACETPSEQIDVDTFFSIPLEAKDGFAFAGKEKLIVDGKPIVLEKVRDGEIG